MKLKFDDNRSERFPQGYWYAVTDDGGYDAVGATPLDAVASLANQLERVLTEAHGAANQP